MKTVIMKSVEFGDGMPKICVPIIAKIEEEIIEQAKVIVKTPLDIVEWRMDWFEDVENIDAVIMITKRLRKIFEDIPILATFRSKKEGGNKEISMEKYVELTLAVVNSSYIDAIDVELFIGDETVKTIVKKAQEANVIVLMSNHDFIKTPPQEEIIKRLCKMQELGADILKIAVMPTCKGDVLTLLNATSLMKEKYADRPIVTISMAKDGLISRLSGEVFGSCLTFGCLEKASAPGQMDVYTLKSILTSLHNSLRM